MQLARAPGIARSLACWLALALSLGGCSSYLRYLTATKIECATEDIVVTNDRIEPPRRVWDARCRTGGIYTCSTITSGLHGATVTTCEDASPRAITVERR